MIKNSIYNIVLYVSRITWTCTTINVGLRRVFVLLGFLVVVVVVGLLVVVVGFLVVVLLVVVR